jgi:hypothetical protein
MNHDAIYKLNPTVVRTVGDVAYDADGNEVAYDKAAVEAYIASQAYVGKPQAEYPAITEQLDTIFHQGLDAWKAQIQTVKDKYPK